MSDGLPSAVILATALKDVTRNRTQLLPAELSKTTLIRNLSVFIAHLESFSTSGDTNSAVCLEASKPLSRALDEALEPPGVPVSGDIESQNSALTRGNYNNNTHSSAQQWVSDPGNTSTVDLDTFSHGTFDNFDLSTWINGIDWTGTASDWTDF